MEVSLPALIEPRANQAGRSSDEDESDSEGWEEFKADVRREIDEDQPPVAVALMYHNMVTTS